MSRRAVFMNVRKSITNKISDVVEALKDLKGQGVIGDDSVFVEVQIPNNEIDANDIATAKFTVMCPLSR